MSIMKNIKQYTNNNLTDILSLMSHVKSKSGNAPFSVSNKNSLRNTLERINNKNKKNSNSKKNKNKSKDSELLINNYLSQRPRLNTEGNDNNIMKMKFSMEFFKNKIDKVFQVNNNKSTTNKNINIKNNNNDYNFRKGKRNNIEIVNQPKADITNNILNKKKNSNSHFTRVVGNSSNQYNKKLIEKSSHNEYNITNIQNFSNTQSYFNQNNKKYNHNNNKRLLGYPSNNNHKNNIKSEDIKKRSFINNKIVKENKLKNFSGLLLQISPQNISNNKITHIQNYFRNIHKNKNIINNQKVQQQYNKEKNVITTEPKDLNNTNRLDTEDLIIKDNSNYLVVSKNPTQITNIIEKKENNKYINNYFNICENVNVKNKNNNNINNEKSNDMDDESLYNTYEEIHFYFIRKIQKGKKFKSKINTQKS